MGYVDYTDSYIDFLLIKLTNIDFPDAAIDTTTLVVFVLSLIISVFLNICDLKENKQKKETKKNL